MRAIATAALVALAVSLTAAGVAAAKARRGPVDRRTLVERGVVSLLQSQKADGSYGVPLLPGDPGVTALCARALAVAPLSLNPALAEGRDAAVDRALRWLVAHQGRDGSFRTEGLPGDRAFQTALAVRALAAADWAANACAIVGARRWLESRQIGDGLASAGAWTDGRGVPSVVVTELSLLALREAGADPRDGCLVRGAAFLARAQRPDGSFEGDDGADDVTATWAGVLGLLHAEVGPSDARIERGLGWLRGARPPGQDAAPGRLRFMFDVARAQRELGPRAEECLGPWCRAAIASLAAAQQPDGSWENQARRGGECIPDVATGYALDALATLPDDDLP